MKNIKRSICFLILIAVTACFPTGASADEKEAVIPMEINDEVLITITEELMSSLKVKTKYGGLYYNNEEMDELIRAAEEVFREQYSETYVIPIDFEKVFAVVAGDDEGIADLSRDEMRAVLDNRLGNTIISLINGKNGAAFLAATSVMTTSRSYVADLDQERMVILAYDNQFSVVADIYPSGEHVITAVETMISTESIPSMLTMLSGIFSAEVEW